MQFLSKDFVSRMASIMASDYYQEWVDFLFKAFEQSRKKENRNSRREILGIQLGLAKMETKLWKIQKEGREKLKSLKALPNLTSKQLEEITGLEKNLQIHKLLVNHSRTIIDGIAWRNLKYDAFFITAAARGYGAGAINLDNPDSQSEFSWAYTISENFGSIVILNDLTHFFRIGDITEIQTPKITFIHDVKKLGEKVNNYFTLTKDPAKALSSQSKRLMELQRSIFNRSFNTPIGKIEPRIIDVKVRTNFHKLKALINRVKTEYLVEEYFERCLKVRIIDFKALKNAPPDATKSLMNREHNTNPYRLILSNWDSFYEDERGNFLRGSVPYSVFPLSNRECIDVIAGNYLIISELDLVVLKQVLREHHWKVSDIDLDPSLEAVEKIKDRMFNGQLFEHTFNDGLILIERGPFSFRLGSSLLIKMSMQFFTLETILNILEKLYENASKVQKPEQFFPILKEREVWN
jgi:hypothetical protein